MIRGGNRTVLLIEALYTIPLTPAPDGWRSGFESTTKIYAEDRGKTCNFILLYIHIMMIRFGSVPVGSFFWCQTSHHGKLTLQQMMQSLQNVKEVFILAENNEETKAIVKSMSNAFKKGGVCGVG